MCGLDMRLVAVANAVGRICVWRVNGIVGGEESSVGDGGVVLIRYQ